MGCLIFYFLTYILMVFVDFLQFSNFNIGVRAIDFLLLPLLSFCLITSNCNKVPSFSARM